MILRVVTSLLVGVWVTSLGGAWVTCSDTGRSGMFEWIMIARISSGVPANLHFPWHVLG